MLHQLPPEICAHIFDFACRDTGCTGRSLSLVSRYISGTSQFAKLQSIALFGRAQTFAFASLLERTPPHLRTTKYLYIGGAESEEEMDEIFETAREGYTKAARHHLDMMKGRMPPAEEHLLQEAKTELQRQEALAQLWSKNFAKDGANAIENILRTLAPNLQLLDIALNYYVSKEMPSTLSFPSLTDLTTRCGFPLSFDSNNFPLLDRCHSLRHLHIVETSGQWHWTPEFFKNNGIPYFAPSLTHLRLSQMFEDSTVSDELEAALGISEPSPGSSITQLPSTLELVLMQLAVEPPPYEGCLCCDLATKYHDLVDIAGQPRGTHDHRVILLQTDTQRRGKIYFSQRGWTKLMERRVTEA